MRDPVTMAISLPLHIHLPDLASADFRCGVGVANGCGLTTLSFLESNPPVRLTCGHAISRDAMKKLVGHSGRYIVWSVCL